MRGLAAVALVLATSACTGLEMERVPTPEELNGWQLFRPFMVQPTALAGIYQNVDVDSVVFRYVSSVQTPEEFWSQIRRDTRSQGWAEAPALSGAKWSSVRRFDRLRPRGELWFSSAEEVRVSYSAGVVVVGWVQSDQEGTPRLVSNAHEGRFADEHVWPKFAAAQWGAPANKQVQRTGAAQATDARR